MIVCSEKLADCNDGSRRYDQEFKLSSPHCF
jgi:hypothetical protein